MTPFLFDYSKESRELHLENIRALTEMAVDDWNRLQSRCMIFPLRDDHLNDMFAGFTKGVIREFGDEEIQAAGFYFKCIAGFLILLFLALLVFTIVIVMRR